MAILAGTYRAKYFGGLGLNLIFWQIYRINQIDTFDIHKIVIETFEIVKLDIKTFDIEKFDISHCKILNWDISNVTFDI